MSKIEEKIENSFAFVRCRTSINSDQKWVGTVESPQRKFCGKTKLCVLREFFEVEVRQGASSDSFNFLMI